MGFFLCETVGAKPDFIRGKQQMHYMETDLSRGFYSENTRNYNTATRTTAICHILYRLVYTACKNIHYFLLGRI